MYLTDFPTTDGLQTTTNRYPFHASLDVCKCLDKRDLSSIWTIIFEWALSEWTLMCSQKLEHPISTFGMYIDNLLFYLQVVYCQRLGMDLLLWRRYLNLKIGNDVVWCLDHYWSSEKHWTFRFFKPILFFIQLSLLQHKYCTSDTIAWNCYLR